MSTTYTNPDAPNPEITNAAVRSMLMQNQPQTNNAYTGSFYYGGGYATPQNPFANNSMNVMSVPGDSRANVGYTTPAPSYPSMTPYAPTPAAANPMLTPAPTFDQLIVPGSAQPAQTGAYNGYPIGINNNYIFDYMKTHTAPKNAWGENYWTMPKPIEQPPIDWSPKPQSAYDAYAQYGMGCVPQMPPQPMLPPGFSFPQVQETWLDAAKKNWKQL